MIMIRYIIFIKKSHPLHQRVRHCFSSPWIRHSLLPSKPLVPLLRTNWNSPRIFDGKCQSDNFSTHDGADPYIDDRNLLRLPHDHLLEEKKPIFKWTRTSQARSVEIGPSGRGLQRSYCNIHCWDCNFDPMYICSNARIGFCGIPWWLVASAYDWMLHGDQFPSANLFGIDDKSCQGEEIHGSSSQRLAISWRCWSRSWRRWRPW